MVFGRAGSSDLTSCRCMCWKLFAGMIYVRESATVILSVSAGTETTLVEGYRVENDVFRVLFGCTWSSD